ncbi:MAG: hypothetical protein FJX29_14420 [Alphaproteobacteria bacterium]|nr:hypothetical protein [Alphaproteobacteria bacterium]
MAEGKAKEGRQEQPSGAGQSGAGPRADRLAAELRENLKRRKQQARERARPQPAAASTPAKAPDGGAGGR